MSKGEAIQEDLKTHINDVFDGEPKSEVIRALEDQSFVDHLLSCFEGATSEMVYEIKCNMLPEEKIK